MRLIAALVLFLFALAAPAAAQQSDKQREMTSSLPRSGLP